MKIRLLVSAVGTGFSYGKNMVVDVSEDRGRDLIRAGHAVEVGLRPPQPDSPENRSLQPEKRKKK